MADLASLAAELGDGALVTDPDIVASYRQDRAMDPAAGTPMAVARPTTTGEVQAVLRWATAHRFRWYRAVRAPGCLAAPPLLTAASC